VRNSGFGIAIDCVHAYTDRMSSLTRRQIVEFRRQVALKLAFLYRCKRRLQELGFTERSELFQEVDKAHRALHAVYFSLWESGPYSTRKRVEELPPPGDRSSERHPWLLDSREIWLRTYHALSRSNHLIRNAFGHAS
jgi:hypothetical protein